MRRIRDNRLFGVVISCIFCTTLLLVATQPQLDVRAPQDYSFNPQPRELSAITDEELGLCISALESVSVNGTVPRDEYLLFIEHFSSSALTFESFNDLPAQLVLVFYTAACSSGRNCVDQEPSISLGLVGASPGLLAVLCNTIKDMAVLQTEVSFQFQIKYQGNDVQAGSLIAGGIGGIGARDLEEATERALLDTLSCDTRSRRRLRQNTEDANQFSIRKEAKPDGNTEAQSRLLRETHNLQSTVAEEMKLVHALEGPIGSSVCDFQVQAQVLGASDFECISVLDDNVGDGVQCALVSARVAVTSASLNYRPAEQEFRLEVVSILKNSFTKNRILDFVHS